METEKKARARKPVLILALGVLGASMSAIFVKYSGAPSILTAAYRLLWTVLLMTPAVFGKRDVRQELLHVRPRTLLLSALSGAFLALHFSTWFEALAHTSVASSTIIVSTEVIWVALGYCFFLKGKLGFKPILAIIISFAGSALIAWVDSSAGSGLYGDLLALTAAVAASVYTLLGRVVRKDTGNSVYTYIVYVSCAAVLVAAAAVKRYDFFGYGMSGIISGFLLAVFSTIMGHSIFSWCLKYFSPSFVAAAKLCEPVISSILAFFLFSEVPAALQLVGCVVVLAGVLFYTFIEMKAEK